MIQVTNVNGYTGYAEYSCLSKDIPNLPTDITNTTGSVVLVIDTMEVLFWDKENKRWIKS